jgi:hypothetical protein
LRFFVFVLFFGTVAQKDEAGIAVVGLALALA